MSITTSQTRGQPENCPTYEWATIAYPLWFVFANFGTVAQQLISGSVASIPSNPLISTRVTNSHLRRASQI
ncbi:hypothetical protein RISK_006180 [Rhodopirellula islandica]|uniref:Uncharacterized protein n=1 Tax=Rhodopirellula islandica TaxID=595434 RepID=A0A0J1B5A9_RHOIS|nr:hypothetical protein RISK_006180 [Rhodopirellula islandica]